MTPNPLPRLICVSLLAVFVSGCGELPRNKPLVPPMIEPCPETPNCVSSISNSTVQGIEPFSYEGYDTGIAWKAMLSAIKMEKRVIIIKDTGSYLHAECRTLLGFVDDVEFMAETRKSLLHVRSASRVGLWDLGVNGRRVDRIRDRFTEILKE